MEIYYIILIAVILLLLGGALKGFQNGFVTEVSNVISLVAALMVVAIFVMGIKEYMQDRIIHVMVLVIALLLVVTVYKVVNFILTSLKIIMKLPIASGLNRILGLSLGAVKGLILIWLFFIILTNFEFGAINAAVMEAVARNGFLGFLYKNNLLLYIIASI